VIRFAACLLAVPLLAGPAVAAERRIPARLCPEDLPEGAHLPPQPGCAAAARDKVPARGNGFVDLSNGTSVRIGGRAGAEYGVRR
jgi:hypothetical protein